MSNAVISAIERLEKPNQVRKEGYIPGIMYGKGFPSKSIKLEQKELQNLLHGHTRNTKLNIQIGNEVKHSILKKLQKDPTSGKILHVELQTVHDNDIVRLKVPLVFHGRDKLTGKQQLLVESISEVEIMGKASLIPEFVNIDVSDRKIGDRITVNDIDVNDELKVLQDQNEVLAVINPVREYTEEVIEAT